MKKDEFIKNCQRMGYCSKKVAERYCEGKDDFTDDDYVGVYRLSEDIEKPHFGDGTHGYGRNGARTTKHYFKDGGSEGNR